MSTWNEADHPRDDEGKFTYKNGGSSGKNSNTLLYGSIEYNDEDENIEDKLYKNTTTKEKLLNYRNKLINFLDDNLDREEILFSTAAELENKVLDNTISTIKVSKEQLVNSINNISKIDLKSNPNFQTLINKAKNTYKDLNDFEVKTNNMFKMNTQKGQNGHGEEVISSVLKYQRNIEENCNEIIMHTKNIASQKVKKVNDVINSTFSTKNQKFANNQIENQQEKSIASDQTKSNSKIQNENTANNSQMKTTSNWLMPVKGRISSPYGWRIHPIHKEKRFHNGLDIAVPIGTPVNTIADGKVIAVGPARGYGNWVAIDHGIINGTRVTSEYGHLSSWNVSYGQNVKQGEIIASSGNTGSSDGPHLHLTIREGKFQGIAVNPSKYIKLDF